jgi:ABC-2 type transport system permease protein
VRALAAQLRLELVLLARNGESLLLTLGIPVVVLAFFANVDVLPIQGEAIQFLAPGVISLAVLSTSLVNLAVATGFEREHGVLRRLGVTPLGRPRLLMAKTLTVAVVQVVQVALLWGLALALGWEPEPRPVQLVAALVLGTAAFCGLALCLAGRLRALVTLAAANGLYLVLLLLSGMVVPLAELPDPLEAAARSLPSTAMADLVRAGLDGTVASHPSAWPVLVAWAVLAPVAATRLFRWD